MHVGASCHGEAGGNLGEEELMQAVLHMVTVWMQAVLHLVTVWMQAVLHLVTVWM